MARDPRNILTLLPKLGKRGCGAISLLSSDGAAAYLFAMPGQAGDVEDQIVMSGRIAVLASLMMFWSGVFSFVHSLVSV
jgi:hypothetical protein